jgi:transcriptional regulator with XRE-family HTH domain
MLTGEQIRAARALARMEQSALASASGLSSPTIKRLEKMVGPISANTGTEAAIRRAFEMVGVMFLDSGEHGPGVRLARPRGALGQLDTFA